MLPQSPRIVVIGAGAVASHLAPALQGEIVQIFSRTHQSAQALASRIAGAVPVTDPADVVDDADVYLVSVADDAIGSLVDRLRGKGANALWLHTSGSVDMEVLAPLSGRHGVFYPLQTFSKGVKLELHDIPLFIEGADTATEDDIRQLGASVFNNVYHADSELRRKMHIAAVFACNFTNHLWGIASELLQKADVPFSVLKPLLEETMRKAFEAPSPHAVQTGPAARKDRRIIGEHLSRLDGNEREIYRLISESIISKAGR